MGGSLIVEMICFKEYATPSMFLILVMFLSFVVGTFGSELGNICNSFKNDSWVFIKFCLVLFIYFILFWILNIYYQGLLLDKLV